MMPEIGETPASATQGFPAQLNVRTYLSMRCSPEEASNLSQVSEESATFDVAAASVAQPISDPTPTASPHINSQNLGSARMMTYGRSNEEVRQLSQSMQAMPMTEEISTSSPAIPAP